MVLAKVQQSAWFPVQPCIEMYISQKFDDQCKFQSHISDFRQRSNFLKIVLFIGDFFALEFRIFFVILTLSPWLEEKRFWENVVSTDGTRVRVNIYGFEFSRKMHCVFSQNTQWQTNDERDRSFLDRSSIS